ncbi:MAG: GDSL-type esterase/lipase family protein [Granulosicoccus sp.]
MTTLKTITCPIVLSGAFIFSVMGSSTLHAQNVNIMPMGDSITVGVNGQCGYRRILTQNMLNDPSCSVSFVGPLTTSSGGASRTNCEAFDTDHAGVSGRRADQFTDTRISTWANAYDPQHYLVHIGSNDLFQGESISEIMSDIDDVRNRIANRSPDAIMLLANVIPWDPQSPNPSFDPLDNPDVDELAVSAGLSSAIESYVNDLNSSFVRLVDVRSGFDNATMTIDGVHPNDLGEAHIALRFQEALEDAGVCDVINLPAKTMVRNEWYQLSLPANPNNFNRVRDIFDNLPANEYGSSWQLYSWNPNQTANPRVYDDPGIDGVMSQGRAYWFIHDLGASITVDMPFGSTLTPLTVTSQCSSPGGCYPVSLTPENTPLIDQVAGPFDWDMLGYPHFQAVAFSDTRVTTPASGPCSGSSGCTTSQAAANQVMNNAIFKWNGPEDMYDTVSGDTGMLPWDGFWVPVLGEGADGNSRWLIAPE